MTAGPRNAIAMQCNGARGRTANCGMESPRMTDKIVWSGRLLGVQPRIRLLRSFDQWHHAYLGYCLFLEGSVGMRQERFSVGVGAKAHQKHGFRAGMDVKGKAAPVQRQETEPVQMYKASGILAAATPAIDTAGEGPPWLGVPPELPAYRARGHRRLDPCTYRSACARCMWGCRMPVEITLDHWNPSKKKYRFETFCYGPKSCPAYRAGKCRTVPGRKGMVWEEEDWVDEQMTAHRGEDE